MRVSIALSLVALASASHAAEIPFHDCRGMVCVDVSLDGSKPRTFLLDTGDVNSTVMSDVARELGWKTEAIERDGKPVPGIARGGEHEATLGDKKIAAKFLVFDRSMWGDNPPPIDGSLTYTFFKDRRVTLDYVRHTIDVSELLTSDDGAKLPGKLELITFGKKGPPIVVGSPFLVNGKSVRAQIDTAYTGTLVVYDDAVKKLGLKKDGKSEFFPNTDGGVNMLASAAQSLGFDRVMLGGRKPTLYFVGDGKNPVHQPDNLFEATVGNALFAHSVVTLDFHSMSMDVKPAY